MASSRIKNSITNILTGAFGQILNIVLNFALRTVFLYSLGKEYAGMSPVINFTFEIVGVKTTPKSVSIDGKPLAKGTYTYNARTATLTFPLAYKDAASIEIR